MLNDESHIDFLLAGQAGSYGRKLPNSDFFNSSNCFGPFIWRRNEPNKRSVFGYSIEDQHEFLKQSHNTTNITGLVLFPEDHSPLFVKYKNIISNSNIIQTNKTITFSFATFAYSGQRTLRSEPLTGIQEITNSPFENALSFDNTARPKVLLQWIANNRAQSALAKADNDLKAAEVYDLALTRITGLIHDVCDMEVEFRLERSPLAVTVKVNGDSIQFDGLPKEFDVETEALFDDFYQARAVFLKTPSNADEVAKIAGQLSARGEEAAAIVARELRQMSRVTGVEVGLA